MQRWMITANGDKLARKLVLCAMRKDVLRAFELMAKSRLVCEQPVKGDSPQADHHAQLCEQHHFQVEPRRAATQFFGRRFIARRRTPSNGSNPETVEGHAIAARSRFGLRCKSRSVQNRIQKIAGAVAGKRPSGAIRAVCTRRQPQRQNPRLRIAKRRHGTAPVLPIGIGAAAFCGNLRAVRPQPRAKFAGDDARIQRLKSCGPDHEGILIPIGDGAMPL